MIKATTTAIAAANFALLVLTACGGSSSPEFRFRIYDASGQTKTEVTAAGVLRNSARETGLEFPGLRPATARRFAQQMRSG
jgi:hypothetical protein